MTAHPELADTDRRSIDRARQIAGITGLGAVMERTGERDIAAAYAGAFGLAQWAIGSDLLAIIEREN